MKFDVIYFIIKQKLVDMEQDFLNFFFLMDRQLDLTWG